ARRRHAERRRYRVPKALLQRPEPSPRPECLIIQPHAVVAVRPPRPRGKLQRRRRWAFAKMVARGGRMYVRVVIEGAVHGAEKIWSLEPPVTEQLGVERRHDDGAGASTVALRLVSRDSTAQEETVLGVTARPPPPRRWVVGLLVAEIDSVSRPTPEVATARAAVGG